jgi:signal transduction histidine kinase
LVLAEGSSERLVTVVRTLLNMARLQAGHFTIDTSEADMVDLVERELEQVKVLAEQKSIALVFKKPAQPIVAQIDVAKVTEAVANYVENAIKYSLDKTTVTIVLQQEGDSVRLEVHDQGMGVPPQERKDLFGRFYRATNARQEQPDGNGIGLYVVKSIAEGHGGEAYYRPGETRGSVFGFLIKLDHRSHKSK